MDMGMACSLDGRQSYVAFIYVARITIRHKRSEFVVIPYFDAMVQVLQD